MLDLETDSRISNAGGKMKVILAVLAEAANTTDNGKLNLLGVFNSLYAAAVPAVHPQMFLVLRLKSSPGEKTREHKIRVVLIDQDGTEILATPDLALRIPADTPALSPEFNVILNLPNLVLPKFGEYRFDVMLNNSSLAEISLSVEPRASSEEDLPSPEA